MRIFYTYFSVIYYVLDSIDLHMQHITDYLVEKIRSHMSFSNRMTTEPFSRSIFLKLGKKECYSKTF